MATATLTSLLTDLILDPGAGASYGTSNTNNSETVLQIQGANCAAFGHDGTLGPTVPSTPNEFCGGYYTLGANTDLSTGKHLHIWMRALYIVRSHALGGMSLFISDGINGYSSLWYATGIDKGYSGDWYHFVIDISNITSDLNGAAGTCDISAALHFGMVSNIAITKQADFLENNYFDAVRVTDGSGNNGIRIIGGTTGDRLLLTDIVTGDDTLKTGLLRNVAGAIFCDGELFFGNAASTLYFEETLNTVIFADLPVATGYYNIVLNDGTTGITSFTTTDFTWKGVSAAVPFGFDSSAITTGDVCVLTRNIFIFGNTLKFGSLTTVDACTFIECANITPNGITVTSPNLSNCTAITLTAASDKISGGSTALHNTLTGVAYITTNDLSKVENHTFDNTGGVGHAIEITTPGTYSFIGNTFAGYGATASNDAAIYNNSGGAVTINVTGGGSSPTYRNGAAATTTVTAGAITLKMIVKDSGGTVVVGALAYIDNNNLTPFILNTTTDVNGEASVSHTDGPIAGTTWRVRKYGFKPYVQTVDISTSDITLPITLITDPQQT